MLETEGQVIDDAVAILHDCGAHLKVAATQLDKLERVLPGLNAANTAQAGSLHHGVLRHLEDESQGDGFDGTSRETRDGPLA